MNEFTGAKLTHVENEYIENIIKTKGEDAISTMKAVGKMKPNDTFNDWWFRCAEEFNESRRALLKHTWYRLGIEHCAPISEKEVKGIHEELPSYALGILATEEKPTHLLFFGEFYSLTPVKDSNLKEKTPA